MVHIRKRNIARGHIDRRERQSEVEGRGIVGDLIIIFIKELFGYIEVLDNIIIYKVVEGNARSAQGGACLRGVASRVSP